MRIFSHTCSNTEIVCALGAGAHLIGVDADSDFPPAVVSPLPKPGRDLDLDCDAVAQLRPDLVLTSHTVPGHERITTELESRGLRILTLDPQSLEDVYTSILVIADAIERPRQGAELVEAMRAAMPAVEPSPARPRIAVEWWPKPVIVPARHSWVTDMIELAGGHNPWRDVEAKSAVIDESVDPHQADAIVMSWCGVDVSKYRADVVLKRAHCQPWPAVQRRQVYPISEAFLGRPGPRLVHGYAALREIVLTLSQA
jgi:iron complex transport system substrate-binding protein